MYVMGKYMLDMFDNFVLDPSASGSWGIFFKRQVNEIMSCVYGLLTRLSGTIQYSAAKSIPTVQNDMSVEIDSFHVVDLQNPSTTVWYNCKITYNQFDTIDKHCVQDSYYMYGYEQAAVRCLSAQKC